MAQDWTNFDAAWYLQQNPDVAASGMDALQHFNAYGVTEGRSPNQFWYDSAVNNGGGSTDTSNPYYQSSINGALDDFGAEYLKNNQDVAQAIARGEIGSAAEHYNLYGKNEGRAWGGDEAIGSVGVDGGTWNHYAAPTGTVSGFQDALSAANANQPATSTGGGAATPTTSTPQTNTTGYDDLKAEVDDLLAKISAGTGNPAGSSNVMGNISDVIAADSPLMKLAEGRARQVANSRGLLNGSMAANAAQDAVLNVALPIGSQQSTQNWQTNQAYRDYGYNRSLQTDQIGSSERMQDKEIGYNTTQADLNRSHEMALQQQQYDFQSAEADLDRALQERLQSWNLNATESDNAARQVYSAQSLYQNSLVNINANTNLSAEQRTSQIEQARKDFDMAMALVEQLYAIDLKWDGDPAEAAA